MTLNVRKSPRAKRDLLQIWTYIAADSQRAADRMLERIDRQLRMLAANPLAGRTRSELAAAIRSFPVEHYVIFYRADDEAIYFVRVRSGYLDIDPDDFA